MMNTETICPTCGETGNPDNFGRGQFHCCDPCEQKRQGRLQRAAHSLRAAGHGQSDLGRHLTACGY